MGTYGPDGLSLGEREPWPRNSSASIATTPTPASTARPPGPCGSGGKEKLDALDTELGKLKGPGGRRWYVNSQGQTFAVIAGPVEFRMGSPADEPEPVR